MTNLTKTFIKYSNISDFIIDRYWYASNYKSLSISIINRIQNFVVFCKYLSLFYYILLFHYKMNFIMKKDEWKLIWLYSILLFLIN